jgi:hypothetical protein
MLEKLRYLPSRSTLPPALEVSLAEGDNERGLKRGRDDWSVREGETRSRKRASLAFRSHHQPHLNNANRDEKVDDNWG